MVDQGRHISKTSRPRTRSTSVRLVVVLRSSSNMETLYTFRWKTKEGLTWPTFPSLLVQVGSHGVYI